jgi:Synergist-CTERM protein sorting domain-containing protein
VQLATDVNGGNSYAGKFFILMTNIDLGGTAWTPIGNSSNTFSGIFDGNSKTISGLKVSIDDDCYAGLFGLVSGDKAVIKDLTVNGDVENNYIYRGSNSGSAGIIVGEIDYGTVSNCTASGTATANYAAGGIAGGSYSGTIQDCKAKNVTASAINSNGTRAGGIVGTSTSDSEGTKAGLVTNCSVGDSKITVGDCIASDDSHSSNAGGVAGAAWAGSGVSGCTVSGTTVTGGNASTSGTDVSIVGVNVGGVVGAANESGTEIDNCTVTNSTIKGGDKASVGGVAGTASKEVSASGNSVDTATQNNVSGGAGSKVSKDGIGNDNIDNNSGTGSCNAGFGALALLAVLPLAWRRK